MLSFFKKITVSCLLILSFNLQLQACSLENQKVITVHGFTGAPWNLYYQVQPLENNKANVTHWSYPSEDKTIRDHAADLVLHLQEEATANPEKPIYFLTHSMGGLVLRAALSHPDCPIEAKIGRAVLLVPPNQGAALARLCYDYSLMRYWLGDFSGIELMTAYDFEQLGQFPDTMQVLVIAGNLSYHSFIQGEHDSRVAVWETHLTTPHYHVVVKEDHSFILLSKHVSHLVRDFFLANLETSTD